MEITSSVLSTTYGKQTFYMKVQGASIHQTLKMGENEVRLELRNVEAILFMDTTPANLAQIRLGLLQTLKTVDGIIKAQDSDLEAYAKDLQDAQDMAE